MPRDAFWAIHSDSHGNPAPRGGYGHFVRRSDNPRMSRVSQMLAGGWWPQDDCAPAELLSRLRDDGRSPAMHLLEADCGTTGVGTEIHNYLGAVRQMGYSADLVHGDPPAGWLHNSAWGGLISPAGFGAYLAASQHAYIEIHTPGAWETGTVVVTHPTSGTAAPAVPPIRKDTDEMIEALRPNGTIDVFDVDPDNSGWHTVVVPHGNPGIPFNEKLPGSWSRFLHAEWTADMQTLTVIGRGWQNGSGGQTFFVFWRAGAWSSPQKQP